MPFAVRIDDQPTPQAAYEASDWSERVVREVTVRIPRVPGNLLDQWLNGAMVSAWMEPPHGGHPPERAYVLWWEPTCDDYYTVRFTTDAAYFRPPLPPPPGRKGVSTGPRVGVTVYAVSTPTAQEAV